MFDVLTPGTDIQLPTSNFPFRSVILIDMPVTKQAIKKVRQDKRKTIINLRIKKALKKAILTFHKNPTVAALNSVYKLVDRTAKTNVIHKNKASRIKSRLSKLVKSATKPAKPKSQHKSSR